MIDNLFIVESPLQALIAVELSLRFSGQSNGVLYRLKGRERNDQQIRKVIKRGNWSFSRSVSFSKSGGLSYSLSVRKFVVDIREEFSDSVETVFFGEFRSQWMHFARMALSPKKYVLLDDGAAILISKRDFLDKHVYYPEALWRNSNFFMGVLKKAFYFGLFKQDEANRPIAFASAFLGSLSEYSIDFSLIKNKGLYPNAVQLISPDKVYFFGSKYSEAGIISREYELDFISSVVSYYEERGLSLVYCAHRDENPEKLEQIELLNGVMVETPEIPAELFVLENYHEVSEVAAAYSSVINNLRFIAADKKATSFRLKEDLINPDNRANISEVYNYFEVIGVEVQDLNVPKV